MEEERTRAEDGPKCKAAHADKERVAEAGREVGQARDQAKELHPLAGVQCPVQGHNPLHLLAGQNVRAAPLRIASAAVSCQSCSGCRVA